MKYNVGEKVLVYVNGNIIYYNDSDRLDDIKYGNKKYPSLLEEFKIIGHNGSDFILLVKDPYNGWDLNNLDKVSSNLKPYVDGSKGWYVTESAIVGVLGRYCFKCSRWHGSAIDQRNGDQLICWKCQL